MTKIILLLVAMIATETIQAQYAYFATRGKIDFEKVTYTRARMRDLQQKNASSNRPGEGRSFNLENIPESNTENYILYFDENQTLLSLNQDNPSTNINQQPIRGATMRTNGPANRRGVPSPSPTKGTSSKLLTNSKKIVYQDLKNDVAEIQIEIDEKYLITDSLQQITWRFTNEYRNIAGYECRRVNGASKDSLYVIAFYTEEIPVTGGPALTSGLPGMILGLVIPELHIQYWATKVEFTTDIIPSNWKDKKAKTITKDNFVSSFGRFFRRSRDNSSIKRQLEEAVIY